MCNNNQARYYKKRQIELKKKEANPRTRFGLKRFIPSAPLLIIRMPTQPKGLTYEA